MWPGLSLLRGGGRGIAFAVVAGALLLRLGDPGFVAEIRLHGFDLMQRHWPRSVGRFRVFVVAIDERSLARYGQWPWPHSLLAALVRRIADGGPRVLGVDIIFAEPDRLSPPAIAREVPGLPAAAAQALAAMPSSDRQLADAMRSVPTVLALAPGAGGPAPAALPANRAPILQRGGDPAPYLQHPPAPIPILGPLAAAARGIGSIALDAGADGIVRRVPLLIVHQGAIVPSLGTEALRVAGGYPAVVVDTGAHGIEDVRIGGFAVPTDRAGNALLHFAPETARYISAADILDPGYDIAGLRGNLVLLGVTGLGVVDQKQTPLGLVQGIDVHAQLIESMLLGQLLHRPWSVRWIELAAALAVGLATVALLQYRRPARAAALVVVLAALLLGAELVLFRYAATLFDGTFPALTALAALGVMLIGALRAAELALRREREAKQRLEGELAAAQAIQMGLLPRRYPAFPERPDIDLFARIEPARMVSGDFYDYLLIDRDRRLFFLIADVSDKGIPAALFMATTKEIVRDAVLRYAPSLERILAEVNRRTTEASTELPTQGGDMMFVTAFAGILDLETGALAYASAGHDLPFIIGGAPGLRRLGTEGGPPLGVLDPFRYPVDRDRLVPGEVLLLYTDGITEAQNHERALYSVERLEKVLATAAGSDAAGVVAAVAEDVRRFVGGADQADDITLLALRRATGGAAAETT